MGSPTYVRPVVLLLMHAEVYCRYPSAAEISQMILASELQLQQIPLDPLSPGVFGLMLNLQPQSVTVLAFSCNDSLT